MTQYKRKLLNFMLFGYGGLMLLLIGTSAGVRIINSDILFQDGPWVITLDLLTAIADVFAFAISSAVLIYSIYLVGVRGIKTICAAFFAITVFHYVAVLCIGWLFFPGSMPQTLGEWLMMIVEDLFLYIVIDCLRLFIVGFVSAKMLNKQETVRQEYNRKARILGKEPQDARNIAFPFPGFVSFKNPIQIGVATMAIVYWSVFLIQYVYYAVMNTQNHKFLEYIGFQLIELGFYLIMAGICYCIATFILIKLDEKMPKTE